MRLQSLSIAERLVYSLFLSLACSSLEMFISKPKITYFHCIQSNGQLDDFIVPWGILRLESAQLVNTARNGIIAITLSGNDKKSIAIGRPLRNGKLAMKIFHSCKAMILTFYL